MNASDIINVFQILVALILIAAVLMQAKGAGMGNIFGGTGGESFRTRRGVERVLFRATIGLIVVFVGLSIAAIRV
ncbi:MAG: preprotein translocase subunit SecG [Chloroflexi bacterium]|jgi:preprotein translocase subunit SecG|nr:MAG: preprotein translocase subunit SecG [Chloroflexota bacterium]